MKTIFKELVRLTDNYEELLKGKIYIADSWAIGMEKSQTRRNDVVWQMNMAREIEEFLNALGVHEYAMEWHVGDTALKCRLFKDGEEIIHIED